VGDGLDKKSKYIAALREIDVRLQKGGDPVADLGNAAAVLKKRLGYSWVGFYLLRDDRLVLGPFQGNPACVFLEKGKGVCWASVRKGQSLIVPDVRDFEGHIACDPKSRSEIVVPLYDTRGVLRGVLDMDHDAEDAFDETDRICLESVSERLRTVWRENRLQPAADSRQGADTGSEAGKGHR